MRDFSPTQLAADYLGILDQAGITFSYLGSTVTGIWSGSRNDLSEFEDQRRDEIKFTIFLTTSQVSGTPAMSQTLVRAGVTYYIEQLRFDAEGTGLEIDVCKVI